MLEKLQGIQTSNAQLLKQRVDLQGLLNSKDAELEKARKEVEGTKISCEKLVASKQTQIEVLTEKVSKITKDFENLQEQVKVCKDEDRKVRVQQEKEIKNHNNTILTLQVKLRELEESLENKDQEMQSKEAKFKNEKGVLKEYYNDEAA